MLLLVLLPLSVFHSVSVKLAVSTESKHLSVMPIFTSRMPFVFPNHVKLLKEKALKEIVIIYGADKIHCLIT